MKNKMFKLLLISIFCFITFFANSDEQFSFDVTEIEITENGNKFKGKNKGKITSNDGIIIDADEFEYDKKLNILNASGNVRVNDTINDYLIFSENLTYEKNKEIIFTKENSKAISLKDNVTILAKDFEYNKSLNLIVADKEAIINDVDRNYVLKANNIKYFKNENKIIAQGNSKLKDLRDNNNINANYFEYNITKNIIIANEDVILDNKKKNYKIFTNHITYFKNQEKFVTKGETSASIHSKYKFNSKDVTFLERKMELVSKFKTTMKDKMNIYNLSNFQYFINEEILKGENIVVNSNYNLPKSDKFYFTSAIIDLKNENFVAKDTIIKVHKSIFDNLENDPRIKGVSSNKKGNITTIKKGIFTSCKKNDNCPPWSIQASEIKHDLNKKEIKYKNAILKLYDFPILYFPKFFHPDPTVKRKSGLLRPVLNNSNILGSSITLPYYQVIDESSDLTFAPSIFDGSNKMIQNEYRKVSQNYTLTSNFGHIRDYKSSLLNKKKNISYFFSKLDLDLNLENYEKSNLSFNIEKVNNDTFLKIFDTVLIDETKSLNPSNKDKLFSEFKIFLDHENYDLTTGFQSYENLQLQNSDRYQYILPYYNFNQTIFSDFKFGALNFSSNGNNDLHDTNKLKSQIINDISFSSYDYLTSNGFKNNLYVYLKNLNSLGKNVSDYKSSPQIELSSILNLQSSYPLKKTTDTSNDFLTPKFSFRFNPSDMKNHKDSKRTITTDNIFSNNRLGLGDSFESGKSLTLGLDYKKEFLSKANNYFELKLASVFRDKKENFIPENTTLDNKQSNIFGSLTNNFSDKFKLNYKFAVDQDLNELQYNDINATFSLNNFVTRFNFIKETDSMGDQNLIDNVTSFKFDNNNSINFNTRRNRKLNLTEYYDLVYEYKNDCLIAGVKYKKTYYEDRDLKPSEDLLFTITLIPLTTYETKMDKLILE